MRKIGLAVGWAMVAAIVWLSLTPSPPKVDFEASDKVGHLLSYAVLMFWFSQLYTGTARLLYAALFAVMGVVLELIQGALGYRAFDMVDMVANALGVLLGWASALIVPQVFPQGKSAKPPKMRGS